MRTPRQSPATPNPAHRTPRRLRRRPPAGHCQPPTVPVALGPRLVMTVPGLAKVLIGRAIHPYWGHTLQMPEPRGALVHPDVARDMATQPPAPPEAHAPPQPFAAPPSPASAPGPYDGHVASPGGSFPPQQPASGAGASPGSRCRPADARAAVRPPSCDVHRRYRRRTGRRDRGRHSRHDTCQQSCLRSGGGRAGVLLRTVRRRRPGRTGTGGCGRPGRAAHTADE